MFVFRFMLYGGLNQMIFLFLFLLGTCGCWNSNLCWYPDRCNSAWYSGAAASKTSFEEEMALSLLFTARGIFLMMQGGWLELLFTYKGRSPGFINGLKHSLARSRVTSKNVTTLRLAVLVIFSPYSSYTCTIFCLIFSIFLAVVSATPSPSSRYFPVSSSLILLAS